MVWQESEEIAYIFYKNNYDPQATYLGKSDSTNPDIYSPKLNGFVEVKMAKGFQCGQFTKSTIKNNSLSKAFLEGETTAENWVKEHYRQKNVKLFILVYENGDLQILDFDAFFNQVKISLEDRNFKGSGSSSCPKKDVNKLKQAGYDVYLGEDNLVHYRNQPYLSKILIGGYRYQFGKKGYESELLVRKLSNTKNQTWIFEGKVK